MRRALEEATGCAGHGDVPVGAAIVRGGRVLLGAGNARELLQDPTAHAEVIALRRAADALHSRHLDGCTLYVTLEPCAMCAGAAVLSRIDRVVFGASDPKAGFAGSLGNLLQDPRLNHRAEVTAGVLADECADLLRAFFRDRR
jgi:tRNA(adenine34) deaminase